MTTKTPRATSVLVLVLILVNGAAVWGQAGWALDHIVPPGWLLGAALTLALGFAAAIELIGVFLATMADAGEDAGLPSGGVRLGSYAVGIVSGSLNFSHWLSAGLSASLAFGLMSAISPFLWSIWSRVRRGRMSAPSRHFWHPIRSVKLIRNMAWTGETDENEVVRRVRGHAPDVPMSVDTADIMATRPDGDFEAWTRGYEDAIATLGRDVAAEAESFLSTVRTDTPTPRRTRTSDGTSVPAEFADMVGAWEPSALSRADMVKLSATHFGVSTRTASRWLNVVTGQPVSGTGDA